MISRRLLIFRGALWCALTSALAIMFAARAAAQPAGVSRVLRSFDFEERRLGNAEETPMHWSKLEGAGLPHYVEGRLSSDRARSGQYSFRLDLNGGSLVYRYDAGQIKVRADAHYRVEGFVRTTALAHARARIMAYLTDVDGHRLPQTARHSELYAARSAAETEAWTKLSVELSAGDLSGTGFLVVELALLQPALHSPSPLGERALHPQDIHGTAWFDDIVVAQVPKVTLSTGRAGNVFTDKEPLRLIVTVNDRLIEDLSAGLVVRDGRERIVYQKSGAIDVGAGEVLGPGRKRMTLALPDELPPGWYEARLEMSSQGQPVGTRSLHLVRLANERKPTRPDARFGIIATDVPFDAWDELPPLLSMLGAGRVKLGVWTSAGDVQQDDPRALDRVLEALSELRITATACLLSPPSSVLARMRGASTQPSSGGHQVGATLESAVLNPATRMRTLAKNPWLELLTAAPDTWQPALADLVARHAGHLEQWQLDDDGSNAFVDEAKMREVYRAVYHEFGKLVRRPDLAIPWPCWHALESGDGATDPVPTSVALHIKPDVLPSQVPLYIKEVSETRAPGEADERRVSVYLEPLDHAQYGRDAQVRDLAQRFVYAMASDARRIDLRLPFVFLRDQARRDDAVRAQPPARPAAEPDELFLVVRTLMTTLGNATFKGKVPIADGIEAFLFDRDGQGILMLWDRGNSAAVRQLALNLGPRPRRVDLWGNVTPLLRITDTTLRGGQGSSDAQQAVILEIGPMPIFILDIDAQLAQLRASVALDNDRVESSFKPHVRRIRFTNPYRTAIAGAVRLTTPSGWTVNPPTLNFSLNPDEVFDREITIELPYNRVAGDKTIEARFAVQGETNVQFTVPLMLKLGLSDVGLQTMALRDGDDVIVQQMITNYGEKSIDYSAYALYPGQARQERLVTGLAPGRTTMKKYRFTGVKFTEGAKVRSGLKELRGNRILNDEVAIQ